MNGFVVWVVEVEDEHATVRTAGNEDVGDRVELELADKRGVALKEGEEFAVGGGRGKIIRNESTRGEESRAYPVSALQIRTVESREPVTTLIPSKATA